MAYLRGNSVVDGNLYVEGDLFVKTARMEGESVIAYKAEGNGTETGRHVMSGGDEDGSLIDSVVLEQIDSVNSKVNVLLDTRNSNTREGLSNILELKVADFPISRLKVYDVELTPKMKSEYTDYPAGSYPEFIEKWEY